MGSVVRVLLKTCADNDSWKFRVRKGQFATRCLRFQQLKNQQIYHFLQMNVVSIYPFTEMPVAAGTDGMYVRSGPDMLHRLNKLAQVYFRKPLYLSHPFIN